MVKSRLSDEEAVQVIAYVGTGKTDGLIKYLNRLLYDKGLGTDCCSRPLAARDKEDLKETCFADGYIRKAIEFIKYTRQQHGAEKTMELTLAYLNRVRDEIAVFFRK